MKVETKFNVADLVKRKFDRDTEDVIRAVEIMSIISDTCYAGTQVFYLCRPLFAQKKYKSEWEKEDGFELRISHGVNNTDDGKLGWMKYREDELVKISKEKQNILLNGGEE